MELPLDSTEKRILAVLQKGFPISLTPYQDMAAEIGIETAELLSVLRRWRDEGKLRRIGAVVNHTKVGLEAGAMVVWQVEPGRIEEVGAKLAVFPQVSHAYERPASDAWPWNLYTMVHGACEAEVDKTVRQMSQICGIDSYRQLATLRELKKVPPTYIKGQ